VASRVPEVDRAAASRAAVAARRARAAVKNDVAMRVRSPLDVARAGWDDPHSPEATMRVRELIGALPGMGPVRTARVLEQLGIDETELITVATATTGRQLAASGLGAVDLDRHLEHASVAVASGGIGPAGDHPERGGHHRQHQRDDHDRDHHLHHVEAAVACPPNVLHQSMNVRSM